MRKLYVTEITFDSESEGSIEETLANHGQDKWTLEDVSELLEWIDNQGYSLDDSEKGIDVRMADYDELAFWSLTHGLLEYDETNTIESLKESKPDFNYQGHDYRFIFLIGDVLHDFLSDAIDDIKDVESIPFGIEITKYDA